MRKGESSNALWPTGICFFKRWHDLWTFWSRSIEQYKISFILQLIFDCQLVLDDEIWIDLISLMLYLKNEPILHNLSCWRHMSSYLSFLSSIPIDLLLYMLLFSDYHVFLLTRSFFELSCSYLFVYISYH